MNRNIIYFAFLLLAVLTALAPFNSSAHERQVIRIGTTDYLWVVGSLNEPVAVDDKTGVDLRISITDPANPSDSASSQIKPVEGLDKTLKVEISAGDKKKTFDLVPAFRDPGAYRAPFYPTVQTTFSYRFFGTINSSPVDVTFSCNPAGHPQTTEDRTSLSLGQEVMRTFKAGSFGCPAAKGELGFPEPAHTLQDLKTAHTALDARLSDLAPTSRNFTLLAIAVGLLGLIAGVSAWTRTRRK